LTDYVRAVRRRKSIVIITALVFGVSAFLALKQVANNYESSASVIIETPYPVEPVRRANALRQRVRDRARLEAIITGRDLFKREIEQGKRIDDLISQVRSGISVSEDSNRENQFIISCRAADPEVAQEITAELADQLVRESSQATPAQSTAGEADQLRQRVAELSSQLHQLEEKAPWLLAISEATPVTPAPPAARSSHSSAGAVRAQQMTIESLKDRQYLIQQQLADLERRVATQRQVIEQQKKNSTLRDNPTYAALISRRAELQGQRDTLVNRQELTDKHPRVTAIADQINAINRQIEELRQQDAGLVSQSPEARELGSLESERNRLKLELEINDREMARRMSSPPVQAAPQPSAVSPAPRDAASARLAQQYLGLKRSREELMARAQDADSKRQPTPGAQAEQLRLIEQATLPRQTVSSNRWTLILAALAAGLAAGACFAVLAETRRLASLQDAGDVERYARVPLLASIPVHLTPDERKVAGRRANMRLAIGAVVAAIATLALSQIFIVTNLFALLSEK
ncbi:MAG TPA: HalX domain-containing protein, partial [Blastocatellia bacterium]|nr:HalX domain-containing protein [Blastocatellia bacterium]